MLFSVLISYRDRDLVKARRCLHSLAQQETEADFEVVLLDYGSQDAEGVRKAFEGLPQVRVVRIASQNRFWSRAQALNRAFEASRGEYLVVGDIDLIYEPRFLEKLRLQLKPNTFFYYHCYMTPKGALDYEKLDFSKSYPFRINATLNTGLVVVKATDLEKINGYDEYFRIWGAEDRDLSFRLLRSGLKDQDIPIQTCKSFHQWHPSAKAIATMPTSWYEYMLAYADAKKDLSTYRNPIPDTDERPALAPDLQPKEFTFTIPMEAAIHSFWQSFQSLPDGAAMRVRQRFELVEASETSKLASLVQRGNRLLEKAGLSYRLTEYQKHVLGFLRFEQVRDFLYYFILFEEDQLRDYAIRANYPEELEVVLVRRRR